MYLHVREDKRAHKQGAERRLSVPTEQSLLPARSIDGFSEHLQRLQRVHFVCPSELPRVLAHETARLVDEDQSGSTHVRMHVHTHAHVNIHRQTSRAAGVQEIEMEMGSEPEHSSNYPDVLQSAQAPTAPVAGFEHLQ